MKTNNLSLRLVLLYALFLLLAAFALSSCAVFKSKNIQRSKIDSVAVSERDSLHFSFKDSAFKKEIIETEEGSIEVEFDSTAVEDSVRIPINADDYFVVKGKVKKVTIRNSQTTNRKDSAGKKEAAVVQTKQKDSVHKKADVMTFEKKKASFNFVPVILIAAGLFFIVLAYRRYKSKSPKREGL